MSSLPAMRWLAVLALVLGACGGGSESNAAFCKAVEDLPDLIARSENFAKGTADELKAGIAELKDMEARLVREAPDSIDAEVKTIYDVEPGTVRVSEQEAESAARAKVNRYIRSDCDLSIQL